MKRRPIDRVLACGLSIILTASPALSPLAAYADEAETGSNSTPALTDGQGEDALGTLNAENDANLLDDSFEDGNANDDVNEGEAGSDFGESETNGTVDPALDGGENQTSIPEDGADEQEPVLESNETAELSDGLTAQEDPSTDGKDGEQDAQEKPAATLGASVRLKDGSWTTTQKVAAGTTVRLGKASQTLKGLKLKLTPKNITGEIAYRVMTTDKDWSGWKSQGSYAGNKGRPLQAVQIKLSGDIAKTFAVEYRVYVKGEGWLGWTSNGKTAGTVGFDKSIGAIDVRVRDLSSGGAAAQSKDACKSAGIVGRADLQSKGWLDTEDGYFVTLGDAGSGKKLEAYKLEVYVDDLSGSIHYRSYDSSKGWLDEVTDGKRSGIADKDNSLEAVKIFLDGDLKKSYELYYRAYVSGLGWMEWTRNGGITGATGFSKHIEAIQVALEKDGEDAPTKGKDSAVDVAFIKAGSGGVRYSSIVNKKLQSEKRNGKTSGGSKSSITGIKARITGLTKIGGNITYRIYQTKKKWSKWKSNNTLVGNKKNSIECIQMKLTGKASKLYDVWYRVKADGYGWLGWAKEGQSAGSVGGNIPIVAYQVKILPTGKTPGSTDRRTVPDVEIEMNKRAQPISSPTKYLIMIDDHHCVVGVYKGKKNAWTRIKFSRCGTPNGNAVSGTYYVKDKIYTGGGGGYQEYYITEGLGSGSFHSILCVPGTFSPLYAVDHQLRSHETHGCYRLPLDMARYIYENVPRNSAQHVYNVY